MPETAARQSQPALAVHEGTLAPPRPEATAALGDSPGAQPLEQRFAALQQLAQAPSVFQRLAAYRSLAALHRLDLRYEQRAKRVLAEALHREEGLARKHLQLLLKRC